MLCTCGTEIQVPERKHCDACHKALGGADWIRDDLVAIRDRWTRAATAARRKGYETDAKCYDGIAAEWQERLDAFDRYQLQTIEFEKLRRAR